MDLSACMNNADIDCCSSCRGISLYISACVICFSARLIFLLTLALCSTRIILIFQTVLIVVEWSIFFIGLFYHARRFFAPGIFNRANHGMACFRRFALFMSISRLFRNQRCPAPWIFFVSYRACQ